MRLVLGIGIVISVFVVILNLLRRGIMIPQLYDEVEPIIGAKLKGFRVVDGDIMFIFDNDFKLVIRQGISCECISCKESRRGVKIGDK